MKFIMIIMIFFPVILAAQVFPYSTALSGKAVNAIESISASIISDSFSPMTHFSEGNTTFSVVPAYFKITRFTEDAEITGEDFSGKAFGAGCGYSVSDDLMLYFIFSGLKMDGDLEFATYNEQFGVMKSSVDYTFTSIMGGGGYDLLNNDTFSIPVYFGGQIQYYSSELDFDPVTWNDFFTYTVDMKTSGDGFLYGVSGGIALSAKIYDRIKITPYFLYIHNFNSGNLNSDIAQSNSFSPILNSKSKLKVDVDPVSSKIVGLNVGFVSRSGFSCSVALGSLISSLTGYGSKASEKGIEMKSIIVILSYSL